MKLAIANAKKLTKEVLHMSVVIVGGHDRMVRQYMDICKKFNCKSKVFTQLPGNFRSQIGQADLIILFTSTVSHIMATGAEMCIRDRVNIECKVKEIVPLGSHHMFLAEVVSVSVSEKYFDKTGKFHLNRSKPICYSHGGYFTLGEQVGSFGYSVRKKDTPKTGTKNRKRRSGKKQRQK